MIDELVFINLNTIKEYLKRYGRGPRTKDYELILAVVLKNFCEKQWERKCVIGFELKADTLRKLPSRGTVTLVQLRDTLKEVNEDSLIDFVIATEELIDGKRQGVNFQAKRFGIGRKIKDTKEIIDYIQSLRYTKSKTTLVIALDQGVEIEWRRLRDSIDKDFPFERLMFIHMQNNKVWIGEIYPNYGVNDYEAVDIIK